MQPPIDERVRSFLLSLSRALGTRIENVLDLYLYVSPETVRIVEIVERGGKIAGLRLAVRSRKKPDVWYYVAVGEYGAKCTCEGNTIGGKICRHIIIGVITWNMISLIKRGEDIDPTKLTWLSQGEREI
ncbi:SWIM zinc finger family protein [Pyrobaculum neutrophilum]|uniref:Zinc finger SWIM domain protein n=1 Tax=Pyrobaculum neutrophilum (strain DSM 2338 / JCM 9278 / NBRC 100436 / V24Sta) TaxID=444157 RepID=B1YAE4_PYRNV|nr:SWIM zinc finger family protein [Pyrobaculum neutrophilum]ACB40593.1 zinc finger SWIM domain protein [Pyrobaculum neutrophilum V24Sta]